jgi:hypothetical protein
VRVISRIPAFIAAIFTLAGIACAANPNAALVVLTGADFKGGAAEIYGPSYKGEYDVNFVYAQPTGGRSTMRATFDLAQIPEGQLYLHLRARDADAGPACSIAVELNGKVIFEGRNDFSKTQWQTHKLAIPAGVLKQGANTLVISNRESKGALGNVPWFMVSKAVIAGETFVIVRDITKDFWVTLPKTLRPFPEPLPPGQKPGFALRGIKGWMWTPEQYLAEIPVLAKYKMNFLMNCYGSMCDVEHYRWGDPNVNRWWEDLPAPKKAAYENIVKQCQKAGIQFCFSMNPNLCSKRALNYRSDKDVDDLWKHYAWMQGLGVEWFNISLDDISQGIDASGQARVVNEIFRRLKARDPKAKMIFTPTYYWGDGTSPDAKPYLDTLARELDKEVYLFWTGDSVVGNITRKAADTYKDISKHRLFLWDNYPVNDAQQTMHLGPVTKRDPDLCEVIDGYMSNSMCRENELNRIPMLTCADYAYNPSAYDPMRSVGQAILHLEATAQGRELLRELVEMYPGFVIFGRGGTGLNPVREQFGRLVSMPHARYIVEAFVRHAEDVALGMDRVFPNRYQAEKQTLRTDIKFLRDTFSAKYAD